MAAEEINLEKEIKIRHFFSLAFGCIIGVGWVVYLGIWLKQAGPLGAILAFVIGGLLMMFIGLCYAELVAMLPVSGGEFAYTYEIFGIKASFVIGWFLALTFIAFTSFEAISAGWIVGTLIPGFESTLLYTNRGDPIFLGSLLLGLSGIVLLSFLNYRGIKSAVIFQEVLTYGLIVFSLIFVFAGIGGGSLENLEPFFSKPLTWPAIGGVLAILITVPFWFAGFNIIPQVMEEKAESASLRMAGKVILIAIGGALIFYLLVILSASMATPWQDLLKLDLPVYGAFEAAFKSPTVAKGVLFAALCGIITTWNTVFIGATRIIFALGRGRFIPSVFGKIHPAFHSPSIAVLFIGFLGFIGVFWGRDALVPIVNVGSFCMALAYLSSCLGVLKMRRLHPDIPRPYRVPGGKIIPVLGAFVSSAMLFYSLYLPYASAQGAFPLEWAIILVWSGLGVLFWIFARKMRQKINERERRQLIMGASELLKSIPEGD